MTTNTTSVRPLFAHAFEPWFDWILDSKIDSESIHVAFRAATARAKGIIPYRGLGLGNARFVSLLTEADIDWAFAYVTKRGLLRRGIQTRRCAEAYERFYRTILRTHRPTCMVQHNIGYAFQRIGHLIAQREGIGSFVMENGWWNPASLTLMETSNWLGNRISIENMTNSHEQESEYLQVVDAVAHSRQTAHQLGVAGRAALVAGRVRDRALSMCFDHELLPYRKMRYALRDQLSNSSDRVAGEGMVIAIFLESAFDHRVDDPRIIGDWLTCVLTGLRALQPALGACTVIVKPHPFDRFRYDLRVWQELSRQSSAIWSWMPSEELIARSTAILFATSSVWRRAADLSKPCISITPRKWLPDSLSTWCPLSPRIEELADSILRNMCILSDPGERRRDLKNVYSSTQIAAIPGVTSREQIVRNIFARIDHLVRMNRPIDSM